jgi:hypothetical protein
MKRLEICRLEEFLEGIGEQYSEKSPAKRTPSVLRFLELLMKQQLNRRAQRLSVYVSVVSLPLRSMQKKMSDYKKAWLLVIYRRLVLL